jgi:WD40 repeat protein
VRILYQPAMAQPKQSASIPQPDWISSVAGIDDCFVSGCYDGSVRLYAPDGTICSTAFVSAQSVTTVDTARTSAEVIIISGSKDCVVRLHTCAVGGGVLTATDLPVLAAATGAAHDTAITCARFSPSGLLACTGSWDGSLCVWDVSKALADKDAAAAPAAPAARKRKKPTSEEPAPVAGVIEMSPVLELVPLPQAVGGVAWLPGDRVVAGGYDHMLRLYDVEAGGRQVHSMVPQCA